MICLRPGHRRRRSASFSRARNRPVGRQSPDRFLDAHSHFGGVRRELNVSKRTRFGEGAGGRIDELVAGEELGEIAVAGALISAERTQHRTEGFRIERVSACPIVDRLEKLEEQLHPQRMRKESSKGGQLPLGAVPGNDLKHIDELAGRLRLERPCQGVVFDRSTPAVGRGIDREFRCRAAEGSVNSFVYVQIE